MRETGIRRDEKRNDGKDDEDDDDDERLPADPFCRRSIMIVEGVTAAAAIWAPAVLAVAS